MIETQSNLLNLKLQNSGSRRESDLHARLQKVAADIADENKALALLRIIATEYLQGIGAAHAQCSEDGRWFAEKPHISGQITADDLAQDVLQKLCLQAVTQKRQLQVHIQGESNAAFALVPIVTDQDANSVRHMVLIVKSRAETVREESATDAGLLRSIAAFHELWFARNRSLKQTELMRATAAVVELMSQVEQCRSLEQACHVIAQESRRYLDCHSACIGMVRADQLNVEQQQAGRFDVSANTEIASFDRDSDLYKVYADAWHEASLKDSPSIWPPGNDDTRFGLIQHRKLVEKLRLGAAISVPLRNEDDQIIGVLTLVGTVEQLAGNLSTNFLRCVSERLATAIELLVRAQESPLRRAVKRLRERAGRQKMAVTMATIAVLSAIMLIPLPYRVRCQCETDAQQRRYAPAPFEGVIKQGYVRPGDLVTQGQLLAEMNGREIRQKLAGATFEKHRAEKKRDLFLAQDDVAQSLLAGMEAESLRVSTEILESKQANLRIVSPVDGVILSGDLEQAQDMPVQVGQTLFEIGALDPIRIEMLIPADEIANVEAGMEVSVWLSGLGTMSLGGKIEHVMPDAEIRDSENVFVAEVVVDNPDQLLRPGMRGNASITCAAHSLGWNLFHKPFEYVSSRIGW